MNLGAGSFDDGLRAQARERLERFRRVEEPLRDRLAAAVALALVSDAQERPCFVLTRRVARLKAHAGQWALPGGRLDPGESPETAALREMDEEVGLRREAIHVLGALDDYPTRSGYVITPVVVWGGAAADLVGNPDEVAEVHRVPLADLQRPEVPVLRTIPESDRPVISIPIVGTHVHAPTAAILYQLREVVLRGQSTRVAHFEQPVFAWQ